jgi:hypothetical protein
MCERLSQCRLYDEFISWYQWHGYAYSSTNIILHRVSYQGHLPMTLLGMYMKLEVLLSASLCAFPSAKRFVAQTLRRPNSNSTEIRLGSKIFNLLREGNHLNVPVKDYMYVAERPVSKHLDAPAFFYDLPFHYFHLDSSVLVEAWFAAPTVADRRNLIEWPNYADAAETIRCPIWKLFDFEAIPKALYTRPGSGNKKGSRSLLHPQLEMLFTLLKNAIMRGNIRVTWRTRFRLLIDEAASKPQKAQILRRQLILSLILGDVHDFPGYTPRDSPCSYNFTSTVQDVLCVPICHQNIRVAHVPGLSLPVRGPTPHPPRRSFYLGVQSQIADYRMAFRLATPAPDLEPSARHTAMSDAATAAANTSEPATAAANAPDAATAAAVQAMVSSATSWARELIDSTRDPRGPDCHTFLALDRPPPVPSVEVEGLPPLSDLLSDDEDEEDVAELPCSSDDD